MRQNPPNGQEPPLAAGSDPGSVADAMPTLPRHTSTPAELVERLELERRGVPFLAWRDVDGRQRLAALDEHRERVTVGRRDDSDVPLAWDAEVSRLHVIIERVGRDWTVVDDGLSQNGTWIGGARISGQRRLTSGDVLRVGRTLISYHHPQASDSGATAISDDLALLVELTTMQRRVLVALCRPFADGAAFAAPATNQAIAQEMHLSVEAVKTHLRTLFRKFAIGDVPQNQKRLALVETAMRTGLVVERERQR